MVFRSIRWRLQIWHTALLAVIVTALLISFYYNQREIKFQTLEKSLADQITPLLPNLSPPQRVRERRTERFNEEGGGPPPRREFRERGPRAGNEGRPRDGFPPPRRRLGETGAPNGPPRNSIDTDSVGFLEKIERLHERNFYVASWRRNGEVIYLSAQAPSNIEKPEPNRKKRNKVTRKNEPYLEVYISSPHGSIVLVGADTTMISQEMDSLLWKLIVIGLSLVSLGFCVGFWLTSRSLRPIVSISTTAADIANGDLSQRIETNDNHSELGELTNVLNDTFEKLEKSFDQQLRFTADASHEMRTPISVIIAKGQFALARDRESEDYRKALQTCVDSAQHMRELSESLLELSRLDSGDMQLHLESNDLATLAESATEMLKPLAAKQDIQITTDLKPAPSQFDSQRLRQALINLISNAIKYSDTGGSINISTYKKSESIVFQISNSGEGIPADILPHIFDRFYRGDRARTHQSDDKRSTGLGLAITKSFVIAHKGTIKATSQAGEDTVFTVELPIV